jgi:hypothetical protein
MGPPSTPGVQHQQLAAPSTTPVPPGQIGGIDAPPPPPQGQPPHQPVSYKYYKKNTDRFIEYDISDADADCESDADAEDLHAVSDGSSVDAIPPSLIIKLPVGKKKTIPPSLIVKLQVGKKKVSSTHTDAGANRFTAHLNEDADSSSGLSDMDSNHFLDSMGVDANSFSASLDADGIAHYPMGIPM